MTQRYVSIALLSLAGALVLTQFQNCAPAGPAADAGVDQADRVRVIDDQGSNELTFATKQVQLRDEVDHATVGGLCTRERSGASLRWSIVGDDLRPLLTGDGACAGGQFKLALAGIDEVVCGVTYQLVVEGDWGGSTTAPFVRRCQPVMKELVPVAGAPHGTSCEIEYQPHAGEGAPGCVQVCYREDQVIDVISVAAARCAPMASRLAGP